MSPGLSRLFAGLCVVLAAAANSLPAADIKLQPVPGNGVVITNAAATQERLRVNEGGGVYLPGLAPNAAADRVLCTSTSDGQVGVCALQATGPQGPPGPAGPTGPVGPAGAGLVWRGAWSSNTSYAPDDAVSYAGSAWVAVAASSAAAPDANPTLWDLLAAGGAPGSTGPQGPPGPAGLGLTIVTVSAQDTQTCGVGPCPLDENLTATCPAGYVRLQLLRCTGPISAGLVVDYTVDATRADTLICHYHGTINAFTTENLDISGTCMTQPPP